MNAELRMAMLEEIGTQLCALVDKGRNDPGRGSSQRGHLLECLEAVFRTRRGREVGRLGLERAIHALAGDVYHFEDFDLTDAERVEVASI